uniref:Endoribonuclease Dicer-like protein 3 n=1 Tax=Noccaea caerulescens TaxID=107243 RepID=A0A1J3J3H8_NOCCA
MEEEEQPRGGGGGGGSNSLKRKFPEIDGDETPVCSSSPMMTDSNGSYESKVNEVAKERNIIALLETGTDKSTIIDMLVKGMRMRSSHVAKRLIIFLAPTVNLVKQQCCEIKAHGNLKVEEYFGAKGVDKWTSQRWEEELSKHDVLVMTPQILLDALRSSFLKLEMVHLLVIDECHRTTGNHPYAKIMKEFYHKSTTDKPKIFGLTASGVVRKDQVFELESLLDSQIFDHEERKGVENFATTVKEGPIFYDPSPFCTLALKEKLETLNLKFDASLLTLQEMEKDRRPDMEDKFQTYLKRLSIDYSEILHCLDNLGLICAHLATEVCLEKISDTKEESEIHKECSLLCMQFLEDILSTLGVHLQQEEKTSVDLQQTRLSAVNLRRVSPKLKELFHLLNSFRGEKQKPCLILVERIITAEVIERFVKKEVSLGYLNVLYSIRNNASSQDTPVEISDSFHVGKVNLVFLTDVVEEGLQVPNCSCVVCFDLPKTVCSYLQSQELAKHSNSKSIMFLERGNTKQRDHLYELMRREVPMRDPETPNLKLCPPPVTNGHGEKKETGATVIPDSSIAVFDEAAATQTKTDPPSRNEQPASKKLHQSDALLQCSTKEKVASAGSKKRKELHGTTRANALSGAWGENLDGALFQAYKFDFCCNISGDAYSSFSLLIESNLAEDVGNVEMDLYLVRKYVKASVSPCGQIHLSHEEMVKAKYFQQFFFNGMFGKLFVGSKSEGTKREFLLQTDTSSLWNPSFMFLLLPVEMNDDIVSCAKVDWSAINSCASVVEFMKKNSLLELRVSEENRCNTSSSEEVLVEDENKETNLIHFANASSDKDSLEEIVVVAIHTGRIYSVVEAVKDSSAMSPFEDDVSSEYTTYAEYFNKKYGIVLAHPNQPLLKLKQSHHAHNLLVNFNDDVIVKTETEAGNVRKRKPNIHAHLPPELLVRIDVPRAVLKSIYLLPSVMHRLESLMLASQLREEIDCSIDNFSISSKSVLEALTTLTCPEAFSMERLELLGDSVLKYVVSCSLFLKYPDKDEGKLSRQRQSIISNSNLHRLATDRRLQGYIRNGAFEPRRWTAPGQVSLFPVPCKCGIDAREVPLDPKFFCEKMTIKIGKSCDMGHRWTVSKSVSDCAEALIGAYYVSGGLAAALHMLKWLGVNVEFDAKLVTEAINRACLRCYIPKDDELAELETKIRREFSSKFLLKEAITHSSVHESYSYERLEFLGDSVLDFLITRHLFNTYEQTGPGEMTDLRSACVNNENFAQVAVKNNLHTHLQRFSTVLETQINEYLTSFPKPDDTGRSIPTIQGPKALGDLVESIAGAMLIDTRLDLDQVWRVFEPLLSPLVTPDKLQLPPYRELNELCDSLGYFFRVKCVNDGVKAQATIQLQLDDVLLTGDGSEQTNKLALGKAASHLLKQLEKRNISRKTLVGDNQSSMDVDLACNHSDKERPSSDSTEILSAVTLVIGPINMKKGGPRGTLHEFCKKHLWPMPTFDTSEEKSRTPFEFTDGDEKRTSFSSFISTITLRIPNREAVMYTGEPGPDKKSSFDSAVVELLYELERRKIVTIQK